LPLLFLLYISLFLHIMPIMNICLMGGWNTDSGASIHGELIGREWVKKGHKLTVLTFKDYAFHGTQITGEDEEFVNRCFTVRGYTPEEFDPIPFLTAEYEIFVVDDLGMLPKDPLRKIYHRIKKKASVVNVIHDGQLARDPAFYQFEWDGLVCFGNRYRNFLKKVYETSKIHVIPYPCHPLNKGDKEKKRRELRLPLDKKIIFGFGPASEKILNDISTLSELSEEFPILLLIVIKNEKIAEKFKDIAGIGHLQIEVRNEAPDIERLYDYLHSVDLLLFNKESPSWVVISSTVYQCLGSTCPIVALDSGFVEDLNDEVLKYSNQKELKERIRSVFREDEQYRNSQKAAHTYVEKNSAIRVAEQYIKLFQTLRKK